MTHSVDSMPSTATSIKATGLPTRQPVAFMSVYDKRNLEALAKTLVDRFGYRLIATGGTYQKLREAGIAVQELNEITGFVELLDGRVKSLHPIVYAGILANRKIEAHMAQVSLLIDTVVVNLYPFEKAYQEHGTGAPEDEMIELIDIGGPSLIRAAAKNFQSVNVLTSPDQYEAFLGELQSGQGSTTSDFRRKMALTAFQRTTEYDYTISSYFGGEEGECQMLDDTITVNFNKVYPLRYGENPHQEAALYCSEESPLPFDCLHGKALSFNNILDMESAWALVSEFKEVPACAVIKHTQPCGVATSTLSLADAYEKAFHTDSLSAFGGVVALNRPVDRKTAEKMVQVFLEVIIAPDFDTEALTVLESKKNLRLVKYKKSGTRPEDGFQFKQVSDNLFLAQRPAGVCGNKPLPIEESIEIKTDASISAEQRADLIFAWKVTRHVKSNSIVLAKNGVALGIGGGQTSRIGALEYALKIAGDNAKGCVMASDGFLPQEDNILTAAKEGIAAIVHPGGSIKDADIIRIANQFKIAIATTGIREFRH